MLIFKNKYVVNDPFNIIFLCGSKFNSTNLRDKRVVLKKYLNKTFGSCCQVIILEENFILKKTNMQYLGYDDIFLNDLSQDEQLESLFANRIIVIHETISTAAEIGMFATLPSLLPKMCILYPDKMSIEENKISGFITLAFDNMNSKSRIGKRIVYYPDIEVFRKSSDKSDYHTYFHNDLIGENLGREIVSFVKKENNSVNIEYQKMPFGKPIKDKGIVSYRINDNQIETYVDIDVLKMQLLSLFSSKANRKQFRIAKE